MGLGRPDTTPTPSPTFPFADREGYLVVRQTVRARSSLHGVAENALDVPHTAFLHGGLFRNDKAERNRIRCQPHRQDRTMRVHRARPEGIVAKMLSPSGGTVTHFDRFHMPCVVEVGTPSARRTTSSTRRPWPRSRTTSPTSTAWPCCITLPAPALRPAVAERIFQQDAVVLELQTESMRHWGSAKYVSTEVDLGPHILRMLHRDRPGCRVGAPDRDRDGRLRTRALTT